MAHAPHPFPDNPTRPQRAAPRHWRGRPETVTLKMPHNARNAFRPTLLALAAGSVLLTGCSTIGEMFSGDRVDYRSAQQSTRARPLEVPPDLTQLARDNRFQVQGGVVSAAAMPAPGTVGAAVPATASAASVAPTARGEVRIERAGTQRWLVVPMPPEQLFPLVRGFWTEGGFTIATESAETGVIETNWAENRSKLPQDWIRSTLGRVFDGLYDTGERDRFRTRIERGANGTSEVYISHRGLTEVYVGDRKENTEWRTRPADPDLEAEFLARLMARLGTPEAQAKTALAATSPAAPITAPKARALSGGVAALEVDDAFDRAWRRVGLALDRGGFSVEDRDRNAGIYYVRYVDPRFAGQEEPGFFARLFGRDNADGPRGPVRYRITLKSQGEKTVVSVLSSAGDPVSGEAPQRIVTQLVNELR